MERVQKILSNSGYCSRRKAEDLIREGRVMVNGTVITLGSKAGEEDEIKVDGKAVKKERKIYLLFHKPVGCVTALRDEFHKTIFDYIKIKERVFPVGRLDYNTAGLLILTNDGDFANQIMHPRYEIKKTYVAHIDRPITPAEVKIVQAGVPLEDGKTEPAKVVVLGPQEVQITIHEGKNRIVRRMLEEIGLKVKGLVRIKIGHLQLGDLKPGTYRSLHKKDFDRLFEKK